MTSSLTAGELEGISDEPDDDQTHTEHNDIDDPPQTWKEALSYFCRKHHRIRATIAEVMEATGERNYLDELQVPWAIPTNEVISVHDERLRVSICSDDDKRASSSSRSKESTWTSFAKKFTEKLSTAWSTYVHGDELYELPDGEEDPGGIDRFDAQGNCRAALNQLVADALLTRQCLSTIHDKMVESTLNSSQYVFTKEPWTLLLRSSWVSCVREEMKDPFLCSLVSEDLDWLLEVLVAQKKAFISQREGKPTLIVFRWEKEFSGNEDEKSRLELEDDLQVPLSLIDLRLAMQSLEKQLDIWAAEARNCALKASEYKKSQQTRLAVLQMKRRQMLLKQIDDGSSKLIQLEQVRSSIETAHSNQSLVGLLSEGASLLRRLSQDVDLQLVENVNDDLQEAMDQVEDDHAVLTVSNLNYAVIDDDELLAELASLSIEDIKDPPRVAAPSNRANEDTVPNAQTIEALRRKEGISEESEPKALT